MLPLASSVHLLALSSTTRCVYILPTTTPPHLCLTCHQTIPRPCFSLCLRTARVAFLQAACEQCVEDLVAQADAHVEEISKENTGERTAAAVDMTLFVGRACRAVVLHCPELQELMLLPAAVKQDGAKFVARCVPIDTSHPIPPTSARTSPPSYLPTHPPIRPPIHPRALSHTYLPTHPSAHPSTHALSLTLTHPPAHSRSPGHAELHSAAHSRASTTSGYPTLAKSCSTRADGATPCGQQVSPRLVLPTLSVVCLIRCARSAPP
jgi:hypothetical protein